MFPTIPMRTGSHSWQKCAECGRRFDSCADPNCGYFNDRFLCKFCHPGYAHPHYVESWPEQYESDR